MGCDYLGCEECVVAFRDECFLQCAMCYEYVTVCEECFDVNKNKFADYKASVLEKSILNNKHSGLIICDNCIKYYGGIDDLDDIDDDYDIDKISLDEKITKIKKKQKTNNFIKYID